jgi:hypothetical protein
MAKHTHSENSAEQLQISVSHKDYVDVIVKEDTTVSLSNSFLYIPLELTLNEARIFFMIASQVNTSDDINKRYRVYVKDLIDILNTGREKKLSKSIYQRIYNEVKSLESKNFEYKTDDMKAPAVRLLVAPIYFPNKGYFEAAIHPVLKPFMVNLKDKGNFTLALVCEMLRFKSYYTQRIYLLVRQYQFANKKVNTIQLDTLRALLSIEDKYEEYYDIKRRILEPARHDIAKTGLLFEIKPKKKGKRVYAIDLEIKSIENPITLQGKPTKKAPLKESYNDSVKSEISTLTKRVLSEKEERLKNNLEKLGLNDWQIETILDKVGAEGNTGIWKLVNEIKMAKRDGHIRGSVGGYTAKKLDMAYQLGFFK